MTPTLRRVSLVLLAVTLASCTGDASPPPGPGATAVTPPKAGGTLRVLLAEDVDALDPQRAAQPPAWGLMRAMHRGLMAFPAKPFPEGARPIPDLAEAPPQVSADGLRYTFRLREGVAFGPPASRPLRAADVVAGLARAGSSGSPIAGYLAVIASTTAPDERTVAVTLARPANDLLWLLALPAASAIPAGLPPATAAEKISPSGPYRLADGGYRAERSIRLIRNDAWNEDSDPVRAAWVDEIDLEIGV
ncbi:MAG: ABC transporter substrate-binding protein, partial [Chloroflexi bacterium]|nr:ABC transporter substrate-binding protein [Chloroflexota bacterium]